MLVISKEKEKVCFGKRVTLGITFSTLENDNFYLQSMPWICSGPSFSNKIRKISVYTTSESLILFKHILSGHPHAHPGVKSRNTEPNF